MHEHCERDGMGTARYDSASKWFMPNGSQVCWWGNSWVWGLDKHWPKFVEFSSGMGREVLRARGIEVQTLKLEPNERTAA